MNKNMPTRTTSMLDHNTMTIVIAQEQTIHEKLNEWKIINYNLPNCCSIFLILFLFNVSISVSASVSASPT